MQSNPSAKAWSEIQENIRRLLLELGWTDDENLTEWAERFSVAYRQFSKSSLDLIQRRRGTSILWDAGFDNYVQAVYSEVELLVKSFFSTNEGASLEQFWKAADRTLQRLNQTDRFYLV